MEQNENQKDKKEKYNLDDDTSSYSPEIEEESNNEDEGEQQTDNKLNMDHQDEKARDASILYNKLINIEKNIGSNQNNNTNYKNNNFNPQKKKYIEEYDNENNENALGKYTNKNINLNESENENEYNNLNEESNNYRNNNNNNNNNRNNKRYNARDNNNNYNNGSNNRPKETNMKEKGCELFIGNLNISTEKDDLMKLFKPFGTINDIRIHKNDESKKCYAFVRYLNKEMANNALKLDSTLLNNRHIKVTKSNENATIFIGNIRKTWTQEELETKIRRIFHNINKIEFFTDPIKKKKK